MLIKQLNRTDPEKIFVIGQNVSGETFSTGVNLCWDWRNASSLGIAVTKPATSLLGLYAGVLAGGSADNYTSLKANAYGLVQCWGVHKSFAYYVGSDSVSCAGQWLIPVNGQYSGQTTDISGGGLSWTSQTYFVSRGAFLMTNDLSAAGWSEAFVRAM